MTFPNMNRAHGAQGSTVRSSVGIPEVARHVVKHTNYFEHGEILRS